MLWWKNQYNICEMFSHRSFAQFEPYHQSQDENDYVL